MSNKYLLPCDCGQSVAVGTSQAGQEVPCACGRQLTVPSLRAIRQLPAVSDKPGTKRTTTAGAWNPIKGAMFAIGAILTLGGIVIAAHSYTVYSQVVTFRPSEEEFDASLATIDKMSPADLFEAWHFVKEHPLEQAGSSPFAMARDMASGSLTTFYVSLIVAAVGLLSAVAPVFVRRK